MLQGPDAKLDTTPDARRRIDMRHDIGVRAPCLVDDGGDFVVRIL